MHQRKASFHEITPDKKVLVSVEEAASMLSLGRTEVYQLVRRNKVQSVKVGRTRRVVVVSLHEFVEQLLEQVS